MEKDIKEQLEKLQYYGEFYAKSDIVVKYLNLVETSHHKLIINTLWLFQIDVVIY